MQQDHTSPVFCPSMVLVYNVHSHKQDPETQVVYLYWYHKLTYLVLHTLYHQSANDQRTWDLTRKCQVDFGFQISEMLLNYQTINITHIRTSKLSNVWSIDSLNAGCKDNEVK